MKKPFVGIAVEIPADRPGLRTDEVDDQLAQQGGLLNPVLRLAEDHTEVGALLTQFGEDPPVLLLKSRAVEFGQTIP